MVTNRGETQKKIEAVTIQSWLELIEKLEIFDTAKSCRRRWTKGKGVNASFNFILKE